MLLQIVLHRKIADFTKVKAYIYNTAHSIFMQHSARSHRKFNIVVHFQNFTAVTGN